MILSKEFNRNHFARDSGKKRHVDKLSYEAVPLSCKLPNSETRIPRVAYLTE